MEGARWAVYGGSLLILGAGLLALGVSATAGILVVALFVCPLMMIVMLGGSRTGQANEMPCDKAVTTPKPVMNLLHIAATAPVNIDKWRTR
jgi:hypothetical protein